MRGLIGFLFLLFCLALNGCGGGRGPDPEALEPTAGSGQVHRSGDFVINTAATTGFRSLTLVSPLSSPYGFVGFYGANLNRLAYQPDPGYLCFVRFVGTGPAKHAEIFRSRPDGSELAQLTNFNGAFCSGPRWSPDGTQIAFSLTGEYGGPASVQVMNADGSNRHPLPLTYVSSTYHPRWDGSTRLMAIHQPGAGTDLYSWDLLGQNRVRHTTTALHEQAMDYSSASRRIATTYFSAPTFSMVTMDKDGGNPLTVYSRDEWAGSPRFSPSGWDLAYTFQGASSREIGVMGITGSTPKQLTNDALDDTSPAWSPDGTRIIWGRGEDLWIMRAGGGGKRLVKAGLGHDYDWWADSNAPRRTLIGPDGSDTGEDPPFGASRPLAIVGFSQEGLRSALTVNAGARPETARLLRATDLGYSVIAGEMRAAELRSLLLDQGQGLPASKVAFAGQGGKYPGAVLVIFSASTGRFTTAIVLGDNGFTASAAKRRLPTSEQIELAVPAQHVYVFGESGVQDMAPSGASRISLKARTAEVVGVE